MAEPLLGPGPAMAERWLSLSWWWACESRRGRSGRGSGRCSGLSVVRGRLRGLSWGNRPHFGADQPRRPQPRRPVGNDEQRVGLALDAMGRRLPGVDVPGVDAMEVDPLEDSVQKSLTTRPSG